MALYIIRNDKVTAYTAAPAKMRKSALIISSAEEIETSDLPATRLVALWNALPGIKPVAKFKDRNTAARRLWAAFCCSHGSSTEGSLRLPYGDQLSSLPLSPRH